MALGRLLKPLSRIATYRPQRRVWLFDLDNTLHDASHAIFAQIDVSMTRAVMQSLSMDFVRATKLRQKYWEQYGATMIGMHKHHGVNPMEFLHLSHSFDVAAHVKPEPHLAHLLQRTPGIKYVFTNAPLDYARIVLDTLGITHCFAGICAIDYMRLQGQYRPKPSLHLLRQLAVQIGVPVQQIILVEDTAKNLKAAKQIGMRTAHIYHKGTPFSPQHRGRPAYINLKVNSIHRLLERPSRVLG